MIGLRGSDAGSRLRIYLQDHLAASVAGIRVTERSRDSNHGSALGDELAALASEIRADRASLLRIAEHIGVGPDRAKEIAVAAAERAGRFKLNGQLLGYSDLSRVVELEAIAAGLVAKRALWVSLRAVAGADLAGEDLNGLVARAEAQLQRIESHRESAARSAFQDGLI